MTPQLDTTTAGKHDVELSSQTATSALGSRWYAVSEYPGPRTTTIIVSFTPRPYPHACYVGLGAAVQHATHTGVPVRVYPAPNPWAYAHEAKRPSIELCEAVA